MLCPICSCDDVVPFSSKEGRQLLICAACRHINWAKMPTDEDLMSYYLKTYTEAHQQQSIQHGHIEYYANHTVELAKLVGKPIEELSIADVGCSIPVFLEQSVKLGCRSAIGVDWSAEAHAYGDAVGVRIVNPDLFLSEVAEESIDVLRYSHTLEHIPNPLAILSSQLSKLRSGGLLYITQPNFPIFFAREATVELLDSVWPTHLHFFNPLSALRLLERADVEVFKFFSVANEGNAEERYRSMIDVVYSAQTLSQLAYMGEPSRGPLNGYPFFCGENSAIYGTKAACTSPTSTC